jgi:hypothetical protein
MKAKLDYSKIEDVYVAGIDYKDAPDFCDAYIESAWYDGREMTADELDELNHDYEYVYECATDQIY